MTTCEYTELICAHAFEALPAADAALVESHLATCATCRDELDLLRRHQRLALRIAAATGAAPVLPSTPRWAEPAWDEVAPGISCKLLSTDPDRHVVSMLVRLAPGTDYPPHTHAGVEELHLLEGELWIDDRKLHAGDHNRAEPGTSDHRVHSETGCTCVLITSSRDVLH